MNILAFIAATLSLIPVALLSPSSCTGRLVQSDGDGVELVDGGVDAGSGIDAGPGFDAGPSLDAGACAPSCGAAVCGDDGCGGSCGSCGGSQSCAAGACTPNSVAGCPPSGPFGSGPGQTASNVTLYDCDGNPVELHSLCGERVSYLYNFAEWCPPCRAFVRDQIEDAHLSHASSGDIATYVVLTAVSSGGSVDNASCQRLREQYAIDTPGVTMLQDPNGEMNSVLGMRVNMSSLVMKRNNEIMLSGPWGWSTVSREISNAFSQTTP